MSGSDAKPAASTGLSEAPEGAAATPQAPIAAVEEPPKAVPAADPAPAPAPSAPSEPTAAAVSKEEETTEEPSPLAELWAAAKAANHPEIWGVVLSDPESHVPSQIVLQKYLNANDGDLTKAKDQLTKTLEWRAKTKPLELVKKHFSKTKFEGLGFVTTYLNGPESTDPENKEVFTWNIYGGVKSIDETFGDLELFIEWRVALMELALAELSLATATKLITATYDPYKMFQVHDYKSISFLRQSPHVKSASAETIKVFAQNYPELLKEKFFVNVPAVMGFVYAFMKLFVAAKTIKKFHPMSNGLNLVHEFADSTVKGLGEKLPKEYGGKGEGLKDTGKGPLLE
ncbi:CRAL-TRIO domain-containing protein [Apodospora peruviana]|uniref:Phosphatidylinositol transfer protein SFH5 n=1 Tax=Apodospora peruviana TaxID=516989 RepID=A0AAE0HWV5_9PEZI|nr:CRAL-TRIO domain-containing protein [Apodospora peruviana]